MVSKSRLQVELPQSAGGAEAVEARIYTVNMDFVREAVLTPGEGVVVDVDPGVYVIEARRPAGGSTFVTAEVSADGKRVELTAATDETARRMHRAARARELLDTDSDKVAVWVRLWDPRQDDWIPVSLGDSDDSVHASIDQDRFSFELRSVPSDQPTMLILEVGRADIGRRWFSLPTFREGTQVVLTGAALTQRGTIGSPLISTPAQRLDAILKLLADPAPGAPEELWSALAKQRVLESDADLLQGAEDHLRDKVRDPLAAAAGALYLVRFEMFDKMHGWARNLADWFPWLADGAAAWAAQLLRDADVTERVQKWHVAKALEDQVWAVWNVWDVAQAWLVHAIRVGPPVFSESVRQLTFGFDAVARHLSAEGRQPAQEFSEAFEILQRWASDVRTGLLVSAAGLYDPWEQDDVDVPNGATMLEVDSGNQFMRPKPNT
jgi:hypothetical protein